jgi:opacity protein-like surface antigen
MSYKELAMQLKTLAKSILVIAFFTPVLSHAEFGIYGKAGTFGLGGGIGYSITDTLTARLGYTALDYDVDIAKPKSVVES